jgi:GT2 family glycosyltransferase
MKQIRISVIIPTFNSVKSVSQTVNSLMNQTLKPFEIIVVNNASTDTTSSTLIKLFGKNIKLYTLSTNMGVTGGRNFGLQKISSGSQMVLFMDHDMVADKKMLEELIGGFERSKTIGIVTPKIYFLKPKKVIWSAGTGINLWTGQVLFRGGKDVGQFDQPTQVQVAPAVLLVKKEVIKKVKEFDSIYFATYEDTDFCFKAKQFGFLTYYIPTAKAYHDLPFDQQKAQMRLLNRLYYIGRNRLIFLRRYGKITAVPLSLGFSLYYLYLAFKYRRLSEFLNYLRGTIDGMTIRV